MDNKILGLKTRQVPQQISQRSTFEIRRKEFQRNQLANQKGDMVRDLISGRNATEISTTPRKRERSHSADIRSNTLVCLYTKYTK